MSAWRWAHLPFSFGERDSGKCVELGAKRALACQGWLRQCLQQRQGRNRLNIQGFLEHQNIQRISTWRLTGSAGSLYGGGTGDVHGVDRVEMQTLVSLYRQVEAIPVGLSSSCTIGKQRPILALCSPSVKIRITCQTCSGFTISSAWPRKWSRRLA